MSSLVLGGAVGTVGDSKSPMLSSPSSPITSFTCTVINLTNKQNDNENAQLPVSPAPLYFYELQHSFKGSFVISKKHRIFVCALLNGSFTCFGFTRQMTLSGQLQILRTGSNLKEGEDIVDIRSSLRLVRIKSSYTRIEDGMDKGFEYKDCGWYG